MAQPQVGHADWTHAGHKLNAVAAAADAADGLLGQRTRRLIVEIIRIRILWSRIIQIVYTAIVGGIFRIVGAIAQGGWG